jgi:site-specific recombinase XerD
MNSLSRQYTPNPLLANPTSKDSLSRLGKFVRWLESNGLNWFQPDLARYRDDLLKTLSPASVQAHLSTIRGQYRRIIRQREVFFAALPADILALPFHEQKAYVDELIVRLDNAIHAGDSSVKVVTQQDVPDSDHLRLSIRQANELMRRPDTSDLKGLRDCALIALLLATGIREGELCNLIVSDLRQRLDGELALLVRDGKGAKQRLIPYGDNHPVLVIVETWLHQAGIREGSVFRGFVAKSHHRLSGHMTVRDVQRTLESYPIAIDGTLRAVKPHDLRRTYARRQYDAGMDLTAIQQNLGHAKIETTLGYIGTLDAKQRRAKPTFDFHVPL